MTDERVATELENAVSDLAQALRMRPESMRSLVRMDAGECGEEIEDYETLVGDPIKDRFAPDSGFFHRVKRDLILTAVRRSFADRETRSLRVLDVGCGPGPLMRLLEPHFDWVRGCDPSRHMVTLAGPGAVPMSSPMRLPFIDNAFDVVVCACVYHHVAPAERAAHLAEIHRVLAPGGLLLVFEHNPRNPLTRRIVARCPIDSGAELVGSRRMKALVGEAGFECVRNRHYLFLPQPLYKRLGVVERLFSFTGLGGQYCTSARKPAELAGHGSNGQAVPGSRPLRAIDYAQEERFHDEWGQAIDPDEVPVIATFEACTAPENRFIMQWLGNIRGLRVLDIGCGAGDAAVYFALRGAKVTSVDLSTDMLEVTRLVAERYGVQVERRQCNAEQLDLPDNTFDIVYAANMLHHVNLELCLDEVARVLKPDGRFVSWDPLRHNPAINVYRKMASAVRTEDETPLHIGDVEAFRRRFRHVEHRSFWLAGLWIFMRFFLLDRVHPSKDRYWKRIITRADELERSYRRMERIDRWLLRWFPWLQRMCWNLVVCASHPKRTLSVPGRNGRGETTTASALESPAECVEVGA